MISYDDLIKKHYILQVRRINPLRTSGEPFSPYEGFGIECGSGWYDLLDELCGRIERELNGEELDIRKAFTITQIKEKFGGLRFYVGSATDRIYDIISDYEEKSFKVCEMCGTVGEAYDIRGWISTLCRKCVTPALMKWKVDVLHDIEVCEKTIRTLESKDLLTAEEQKELSEAEDCLLYGRKTAKKITVQLNNEVTE